MKTNRICATIVALCMSALAPSLQAQDSYPTRPIKFVVPFAPGGITDLTARVFGKSIADTLHQPVIMENRPGAGATIGANHVARAAPDGYTMLLGTNVTHAISPQMMLSVPYDPLKDFAPVAMFGLNGNVLVVRADFPAKTFGEFIDGLKKNKGEVNYASGSVGSSAHLAAELLKQDVPGLNYMHVPYGGPSEAMTAVIGGHVEFMFANIGAAVSQINAGKVRALAVTTAKRVPQLPDVPTIAESGVPGFEVVGWLAAFMPENTPAAIITQMNKAINAAQDGKELRTTLDAAALIPVVASPEETAAFVQAEYEKWGRVIRTADIPKT